METHSAQIVDAIMALMSLNFVISLIRFGVRKWPISWLNYMD